MGWDEIKKVNTDMNASLNHMIWINDYKTYTTNSYVYNNAAILDELLSDYWICINDMAMRVASFKKAIEKSQVGKAITAQSNIEGNYSSIKTLADLYATTETELIDGMLDSTGKLQWLTSNSLITIPPSVTDAGLSQGKTSLSTTLVNAWAADSSIVAKYTADVDTWYNMTQTYQTSAVSAINTQTNIKKVVDNSTTKTITSDRLISANTGFKSNTGAYSSPVVTSYTSNSMSLTDIRYVAMCSISFDRKTYTSGSGYVPSSTCSADVFSKYSYSSELNGTGTILMSSYSIIPVSSITTTTGTITISMRGYTDSANDREGYIYIVVTTDVNITIVGIL